ncbi:MAG: NrfD/PsrC family molybdoenzyme membrane anchor subunit [bacterium]
MPLFPKRAQHRAFTIWFEASMFEQTITRHNELIDPSLHVWGWEIPVYLFIGGLVAGIMVISGYFVLKGQWKKNVFSCFYLPHISLILLSAGMFSLFLDLEHKLYVWRLYTTFQIASPMSWGAWILVLIYPILFLNTLIRIPVQFQNKIPIFDKLSAFINKHPFLIKNIGIMNMLMGTLLGMYTGVLLSSLGARPLWNSSMLWMLFLVSGLSSAAAFVHLITNDEYERELLAKADNAFLTLELFVFGGFISGLLTSTRVHIEAVRLILDGAYAAYFWVFVILLGIIVPLGLQLLAVNHKVKHTPVAPILVIAGGLFLRFIIVAAGQVSHWTSASIR